MRDDVVGMFWDDRPPPRVLKAKPKRVPPERVWEAAGYVPPYAQRAFNEALELMTPVELWDAHLRKDRLLVDVETYINYFLVAFTSYSTGKGYFFEMHENGELNREALRWVMENFTLISFNGNSFDVPIIALAVAGRSCEDLKIAANQIITLNMRGQELLKAQRVKSLQVDHIDLIEVAPLSASLKIYAGRIHAPSMVDLPFAPDAYLQEEQKQVVRWYCFRDLENTGFLYKALEDQVQLRERLSAQYRLDLRSKSDAQIAEAVITSQVARINGGRPQRPEIDAHAQFFYQPPVFLQYRTERMQWALDLIRNAPFTIGLDGTVAMPDVLKQLKIEIAKGVYRMGVGGLHSSEQKAIYRSSAEYQIKDRDVVSYYPAIILNCGLFPPQMGNAFLQVYRSIVRQRLEAKARGDKATADSLKITINGTFGKLASPYSVLYSPNLLVQVTVTGQLALLMLIESLELAGVQVLSANTDGVTFLSPTAREAEVTAIIQNWEAATKFETEETLYAALYSRDVNNYIAVKADGKTKNKGAFANPWADPKQGLFRMHKNPSNQICIEAVEAYLVKGTPLEETVHRCTDVRKFVSVRAVKGGAVKDGIYLGKAVRWYYATGEAGELVYASSGNKVPRSHGAVPLIYMPSDLPENLDHARYIAEARSMLVDLGVLEGDADGEEDE